MQLHKILSAMAICTLMCACGSKPQLPAAPSLVNFEAHQNGQVEPVGGAGYGNITERIAALPQDVYTGSAVAISSEVFNEGGPSKGLQIVLKGDALSLFDAPREAKVVALFDDEHGQEQVSDQKELTFAENDAGDQEAVAPDIAYKKRIRIFLSLPAASGGEGDVQMFVYPLDKKGKTSAVVAKHYRVLSENG